MEGGPTWHAGRWEQRQRFRWEQAVRTRCRCIDAALQLRLTLCTRTRARFSQYLRKKPIGCWNKLVPPIDQLWEPIDPQYLCFLFSLQYLCFSNTFVFGYFSNPQYLIPGIRPFLPFDSFVCLCRCVFVWTSFLFELCIRLVLHAHSVTTKLLRSHALEMYSVMVCC